MSQPPSPLLKGAAADDDDDDNDDDDDDGVSDIYTYMHASLAIS
jgi:hypothetical protein